MSTESTAKTPVDPIRIALAEELQQMLGEAEALGVVARFPTDNTRIEAVKVAPDKLGLFFERDLREDELDMPESDGQRQAPGPISFRKGNKLHTIIVFGPKTVLCLQALLSNFELVETPNLLEGLQIATLVMSGPDAPGDIHLEGTTQGSL